MSEQLVEQPVSEQPITEADIEPDAPASIMEHARTFGPQAEKVEPEPDPLKPIRPVDQQKREAGKFAEGRQRMKAGDAVKRINELVARSKGAEEKLATAEAELTRLRAQHASPARIEAAEQRVETAERRVEQPEARRDPSGFPEPEPQEDDPKFGGDYTKYVRAVGAWEGRKGAWEYRQNEQRQSEQAKQHQTWDTRIAAAVAKYPDYMTVARNTLQRVPQNSAIHVFVEDDPSGEDVLYYLGTNPQELDAILRMPTALAQVKAVSLLSQRLTASPTSTAAGTTGSVAGRTTPVVLPKPPNPVRTEAQRASDSPPTGEPSSIAEHRKRFAPSTR
jgi:hypothetical protein